MSNEWQELDIQNLPGTDVFNPGSWEWQHRPTGGDWGNIFKGISHEKYPSGSEFSLPLDGEIRIRRPEGWEPKGCPTCGYGNKAYFSKKLKLGCCDCGFPNPWYDEQEPDKCPTCGSPHKDVFVNECILLNPHPDPWHDEPKAPTHEEIMTKWWRLDDGVWFKVDGYHPKHSYHTPWNKYTPSSFFTTRQSADIPPAG